MNTYPILSNLHSPDDLKKLPDEKLDALCKEIRSCLIETISKTGGHLASNLGVVELTVALHRVFSSPQDKILWDVGHQSYVHKLLTGRFPQFDTIRTENGLSGFPRSSESEHDVFLAGHSSTSISAACGIARANLLKGNRKNKVIAVIGDGAFTGGMAYEALNNAEDLSNLIVLLNNNKMSISENVGNFAHYLATLRAKPSYLRTKVSVENLLDHTPVVGKRIKNAILSSKSQFKQMVFKSNFFTDLGFAYYGPVDGHNLSELVNTLRRAQEINNKPVFVNVVTTKGKGYAFAEASPTDFHGVSQFDISTGDPDLPEADSFSSEFGKEMLAIAEKDATVCAITAAMRLGTGLEDFSFAFPDRCFDVGIAEEHAVTFAAGLAANGMRPVFAVYSTFLQRGIDQIIHDAAIENRHIVLAVDRAGVVGSDGETHQGLFDVALLSKIPRVTIFSPADYAGLRLDLRRALYETDGIAVVRYPRGRECKLPRAATGEDFVLYGAGDRLILTYGRIAEQAVAAADKLRQKGVSSAVLRLDRIWPIPEAAVEIAGQFESIFFFEEGVKAGSIAQAFLAALYENGFRGEYRIVAPESGFVPQASVENALKGLALDADSMVNYIMS